MASRLRRARVARELTWRSWLTTWAPSPPSPRAQSAVGPQCPTWPWTTPRVAAVCGPCYSATPQLQCVSRYSPAPLLQDGPCCIGASQALCGQFHTDLPPSRYSAKVPSLTHATVEQSASCHTATAQGLLGWCYSASSQAQCSPRYNASRQSQCSPCYSAGTWLQGGQRYSAQGLIVGRPWASASSAAHRPLLRGVHTVTRSPQFAMLTDADVAEFRRVLGGSAGVVQEEEQVQVANCDWMGKFRGSSTILLHPQTAQQLSGILQHCHRRQLAVVPQGGNTGLVGGSVPVFDEVIVSMSKMNRILEFDDVSGILVCQAGCVLETLDAFLAAKGFCMPLDLGAKGSCQIGGNVSTNAGGLRLLRYGSLRGTVLGVEVVLPDGSLLNLLKQLRKDNTGYDLKQLFIGSEGTLGIISKVAILTPPRSSSVHVAFFGCPSYAAVLELFKLARAQLGEVLSAFELLDRASLDLVLAHLEGTRDPLPDGPSPFYTLLETSGSNEAHDREKLDSFLEGAVERGLVQDGAVAQDSSQVAALWRLREGVAEALQRAGAVYKYDLSIPVAHLYDLVTEMRTRLEGTGALAVGYGHVGDGNLHLNIHAPEYSPQILERIEPFVYEWTAKMRGSVSAEHGLGFMKAHAMPYSQTPESIVLMKKLKQLFDPKGILNPYKMFPPDP